MISLYYSRKVKPPLKHRSHRDSIEPGVVCICEHNACAIINLQKVYHANLSSFSFNAGSISSSMSPSSNSSSIANLFPVIEEAFPFEELQVGGRFFGWFFFLRLFFLFLELRTSLESVIQLLTFSPHAIKEDQAKIIDAFIRNKNAWKCIKINTDDAH